MTDELICMTTNCEVSLVIEPLSDTIIGLKIRIHGVTKAEFDLALVWDVLKDGLKGIENPSHFLGIDRRSYEATNIPRLTEEWLNIQAAKAWKEKK